MQLYSGRMRGRTFARPGAAVMILVACMARGGAAQEPTQPIRFWTGIGELAAVTIYVPDQERALIWYTEKLGFEVRIDEWDEMVRRHVAIAPPGQDRLLITLEQTTASQNPRFRGRVGSQGGWVFHASDLIETYMRLQDLGVRFTEPPTETTKGLRAMFVDLLGNEWILLQPAGADG